MMARTITQILGDGSHPQHRLAATRLRRGNWHCEERVDGRLCDEQIVNSKREARTLLTKWGAMKLWECPAIAR